MDRFQYLVLMGLCVAVTMPLEWVFKARVWRRPVRLLRAVWLPALAFSVEDVVAIASHHWTYSRRYTTGWLMPGRLPVEEVAFFLIIPVCGVLTLEAVRRLIGDR